MSQPIFVTGGAGFMGSVLVRKLVQAGRFVALLLKPTTDTWRIADVLSRVRVYHGDLNDAIGMEKIIQEIRPRGVFHFAASNIKSGVNASDEELMRVNFLGTANLLRAVNDIPYDFFVNTGSFLEYGMKDHSIREDERCEPGEVYSITKLSATLYAQALARREKKPIITFRIFSPYGPAMERGRLLYEMITRALRNEEVALTHPSISRDFIFVGDIADIYMEAMEKARQHPGEIFHVGSGTKTTLGELSEQVLRLTGSNSNMKWGGFHSVAYDSDAWQADMTKIFAHFSWRPKHTVAQGLAKTINWYKQNT